MCRCGVWFMENAERTVRAAAILCSKSTRVERSVDSSMLVKVLCVEAASCAICSALLLPGSWNGTLFLLQKCRLSLA